MKQLYKSLIIGAVVAGALSVGAQTNAPYNYPKHSDTIWVVNPLFGYNRNKIERDNPRGGRIELKKSAAEYGLYTMIANPRYTLNDFLFYTQAYNRSDVFGNLAYLNLYGAPRSLTWNLGGGHLYHKIKTRSSDVRVNVPMVKMGVRSRIPSLGLSFNPYIGYAWERVSTSFGNEDNDSILYGLGLDWRWRMLMVNARYYYQYSRDHGDNYSNYHLFFMTGITRSLGAMMRLDHMEHSSIKDTSIMAGPVFVF